MTEQRIIFLHLPKCGGSTFDQILERIYPKQKIFTIKVKDNQLMTKEFLELDYKKKESILLLKGHMYFGLHNHFKDDQSTKYITFIRSPVSRIKSFYSYVLKTPNHRLFEKVSEMTFKEFVFEINEEDVHNNQIRWISGINCEEGKMLNKAIENVDKYFSFVGLTERYNESLILMKDILNWPMPYYSFLNNSSSYKINVDEETLREIEIRNNGDILFYNFMKEKFNKIVNQNSITKDLKILNFYNNFYNSTPIKFSKLFLRRLDQYLNF